MHDYPPTLLKLLDDYQHEFPLVSRPYQAIAEQLGDGWTEAQVMDALRQEKQLGKISRIGAVWAPHRIGVSTLAAIAVAPHALDEAAAIISQFTAVNHNYARQHTYNLWFVVTAANAYRLTECLRQIEAETIRQRLLPLLTLPLLKEYHIDLGFSLCGTDKKRSAATSLPVSPVRLTEEQWRLVAFIQEGIPITSTPYQDIATQWGREESAVIDQLANWLSASVMRRFGLVLHHREVGYRSNAMCVWQIPLAKIDEIGEQLASEACVRLCYQRPARGEAWPYTLFAMIHGKDAASVRQQLLDINHRLGLAHYASDVLFSTQRYKQCGARYF